MDDYIYSDPRTLQQDQDKCLDIVINALKNGSLNLIIGAGVSMSTNKKDDNLDIGKKVFPSWIDLTINCCESASIDFDQSKSMDSKYVLRKLKDIRDYCAGEGLDFNEFIKENIDINITDDIDSLSINKKGFPSWIDLAMNCCESASIDFDQSKSMENKYVLSKLEDIRDYCKRKRLDFNEFIKENLYRNVIYDINSLKTDLLIAIGALVMNSSKSSLTNVVNYNFDDILEWYLTYHGFDLQIISEVNKVIYSSDTIFYHPHGFLPYSNLFAESTSEKIILSKRDYVSAKWNEDFWNSIQRNIFSSKINLFIGMSGEDTHVEDICQYSYEKIVEKERILGVMILSVKNKDEEIEKQNNRNGIVVYYINEHSELPGLLLKIIRAARGIEY